MERALAPPGLGVVQSETRQVPPQYIPAQQASLRASPKSRLHYYQLLLAFSEIYQALTLLCPLLDELISNWFVSQLPNPSKLPFWFCCDGPAQVTKK
eukprot:g23735.t1